jgi:hypothetical protein
MQAISVPNKRDRLLFPALLLFNVLQSDPARSELYFSVKLGLVGWINIV